MPRVAYMVTIEVDPEIEVAWSLWHAEVHVPDVLAQPGFLGAQRYRDESPCFDGWVRYVCRYDVESRPALQAYFAGTESTRLREDHTAHWGPRTRVARQILHEV